MNSVNIPNKMKLPKKLLVLTVLIPLSFCGCQTNPTEQILSSKQSAVAMRNYQTRAFDTSDKNLAMRNVISTLQDLHFVLEKADHALGTVTGVKFVNHQPLRMSVTVRPKGEKQLLVRANAQYQIKAVEDPIQYQNFFAALSKSLFLMAHEVD